MGKKKKTKKTAQKGKISFVARNLEFDVTASQAQMKSFARKIARSQKRATVIIERKRNGRQR